MNRHVVRHFGYSPDVHVFIVPNNVFAIRIMAVGGGEAGYYPDFHQQICGRGGHAGRVENKWIQVKPKQELHVEIGRGGHIEHNKTQIKGLTEQQIMHGVYGRIEPEDTVVIDATSGQVLVTAKAAKGFSAGVGKQTAPYNQSGMAALPRNAGDSYKNPSGNWIGYGGCGGGGKLGGRGSNVYSNGKSSVAEDAQPDSGCGGGGCALLLSGKNNRYFVPGKGAAGFVKIFYEQ